jgi:hypothetical protein
LLAIMKAPGWRPLALTALSLIALTAIHPQMIPVLAVIWVAYRGLLLFWGRRPTWRALAAEAAAFAATLPLLGYNAWILFRDPTVAEWAHQWRHQAPGPVSLAVSLGVPLVLAIVGMSVAWRRRDEGLALLLVWPPLVVALLYLPNLANIQRRLLDALFVPIGILAAVGLTSLTARLRPARGRRVDAMLLTVCCFSSAIVLAIALRFASGAFGEAYINDDAWQAMRWLSAHHQVDDRVLSAPAAGQLLPAWAGVPVYVGHYSETLDYFQKIRNVSAILSPSEPDSAVQSFFAANRLTLLYWGPDEGATGFQPDDRAYLYQVYRHGAVTIYRVARS